MFTCRFDTSVTRLLLDRGADITLRSKVSSVFLLSISTVSPRGGVVVVTYKPFGYRDNDECHQSPPFTLTNVPHALSLHGFKERRCSILLRVYTRKHRDDGVIDGVGHSSGPAGRGGKRRVSNISVPFSISYLDIDVCRTVVKRRISLIN